MSTVVLLSSSPPRTFARSPTPYDSSPKSLLSPGPVVRSPTAGSLRFKSTGRSRDSFSVGLGTPRSLLTTRVGAENIPLRCPPRDKFKPVGSQSTCLPQSPRPKQFKTLVDENAISVAEVHAQHKSNSDLATKVREKKNDSRDADLPQNEVLESVATSEMALPRKLDWTPPKPVQKDSKGGITSVEFSESLMKGFVFEGVVSNSNLTVDIDDLPTKRRRIELVQITQPQSNLLLPHAAIPSGEMVGKVVSKKKNKSPTKKSVTITGRATTLYEEEHLKVPRNPPLLEYLTATQLGGSDNRLDLCDQSSNNKKSKPKAPIKSSRVLKKGISRSRLVSPKSVMKTLAEQDVIFGSASQLVREDSPTFLRDTIEATRQSELYLSSDPISPQQTQSLSIEAVSPKPAQGTRRFLKQRNLWSAAGRDEDNALLHIDAVDLSDSPAVRLAFTGKDALIYPASPVPELPGTRRLTMTHSQRAIPAHHGQASLGYIANASTHTTNASSPMKVQTRTLHSAASKQSHACDNNLPQSEEAQNPVMAIPPSGKQTSRKTKKPVEKPLYAGFTDFALRKQLQAYGFKPVKKREKMIELLDRCWQDQHGSGEPQVNMPETAETQKSPEVVSMTHENFLSTVHGVAARPQAKVKKPRAKRKSEEAETTTPKEPKKRKTQLPKVKELKPKTPKKQVTKPKTPAKRKTNASGLSEEFVLDLSSDVERMDVNVTVMPENVGQVKTKSSATKRQSSKTKKSSTRPEKQPTPPPASPKLDLVSSPAVEPTTRENKSIPIDKTTSKAISSVPLVDTPTKTPSLPSLQAQIRAAIMFQSTKEKITVLSSSKPQAVSNSKSRCNTAALLHLPTWREKILMYDPIVLEDLTAWLNTKGFRAIHEDREVSALDVREWCEANGICCYGIGGGWRGNGGKRAARALEEE